jgi:hypothetical protein
MQRYSFDHFMQVERALSSQSASLNHLAATISIVQQPDEETCRQMLLRDGGSGQSEQVIETFVDPSQPEVEQVIESILAPTHTDPLETLLDEPFAGTLYQAFPCRNS